MIKNFLTSAAAGALLLGATVAYAQDTTQPMNDSTTAPTTMQDSSSAAGDMNTTKPAAPDAAANTNATTDTANQTAAAGSETYITHQAPDQISANSYIGQTVYNPSNEKVGDINDLILKKDGGIVAAVIGVGGFLGIGEKYVAVPIDNIAVSQNPDGRDLKLTTTETADSLKGAPEFKTLAMQNAEKNRPADPAMDTTTTSSTTPDATMPAAPAAPAPATPAPANP